MPITVLGRTIFGGSSQSVSSGTGSGLQRPTLIGSNATATSVKGGGSTPGGAKTQSVGRAGYTGPMATNAGSDVTIAITGAQTGGWQGTFPLPADGDYVAMIVTATVIPSSQTTINDILGAL